MTDNSFADAERESYFVSLTQVQKEMDEVRSERTRLVSLISPLQVRGALESIYWEFRDRHNSSPSRCSVSVASLGSPTAFFRHWLQCEFVGYHDSDAVLAVRRRDGNVCAQADSQRVRQTIPQVYNIISHQVHSVPLDSDFLMIPAGLTGDQKCALATVLTRHHYLDIRASDPIT